jgi:hypothetical protein
MPAALDPVLLFHFCYETRTAVQDANWSNFMESVVSSDLRELFVENCHQLCPAARENGLLRLWGDAFSWLETALRRGS